MGFLPARPPNAAVPRLPAAAARAANDSHPFKLSRVMSAPSPDASVRTPVVKRLRFSRSSRLAHSRDFARVRQVGERLAQGCLIANWHQLPAGSPPRLGVVTAKKIGGAVARARARRLLRESFRLHQQDLALPVELVLVARNSIAGKKFAEVEKDYLTALKRAGLKK